jgi:hypothetical protein
VKAPNPKFPRRHSERHPSTGRFTQPSPAVLDSLTVSQVTARKHARPAASNTVSQITTGRTNPSS